MDPPVCRTCGKKHWNRLCSDVTEPVTVTKPVTEPVTKPVTPKLIAPSELRAAHAQIAALRAEIAMLEQKLASQTKLPMSAAERQRRRRAGGQELKKST